MIAVKSANNKNCYVYDMPIDEPSSDDIKAGVLQVRKSYVDKDRSLVSNSKSMRLCYPNCSQCTLSLPHENITKP